ncbi:MAG: xylulokinase [Gemmatales bacterium]|nr:xylulokinase [Gemmatales bacterium]MDW8223171.1 xylulokinase [Gemmatales bacterium]
MSVYLGIDIGTSGTKTVVCRAEGTILATATAEHPSYFPQPGWSEQDPEDWWKSTVQSVRQALARAGVAGHQVRGIGLSGQMHGSVFLDAQGQVLRRAILWNDQRTAEQCQQIEQAVGGREQLIRWVSNPAFTGFTAPKILWVRQHEPHLYERTRKILLPKDYIRYRLTGEFVTEVSDASGTLLLDVAARRWCRPLLDKLQIAEDLLPACVESQEITGKVRPGVAEELGIAAGIPVVGGAGDQAAGAVGNGIVRAGIMSATMGTSGVVFAHSDRVQTDPQGRVHTMCHAVKGTWHLMGVVLSAGGSLQWFRNHFATPEIRLAAERHVDAYDLILALAEQAPPGAEGLFFLPYLTGERHPHSDPWARGAWVGLTVRHGWRHLARAVVEGATFALRDCLEVMAELGIVPQQIRLSGGGARSAFWRRVQADIYGQKVALINATEGPAFGVALLAMVGTGAYASVPEACDATIRVTEEIAPCPQRQAFYNRCYATYRQLYPALRHLFPELSRLSHM